MQEIVAHTFLSVCEKKSMNETMSEEVHADQFLRSIKKMHTKKMVPFFCLTV